MVQAMEQLSDKALPEWAAFAATLARRLAELLPLQGGGAGQGGGGGVALGDPIWKACVDNFLLKAVDIDSQVPMAVLKCPGLLLPFQCQSAAQGAALTANAH